MELILIRHGLPERSHETNDPPLAAEGHEQARRLASALSRERIDAVGASPMRRAVQTAEAYAALSGHEIRLDSRITEFERNPDSYVPVETLKRENYEAWKRFVALGQGGAAIGAFQKRVVEALEEVIAAHRHKRVAVFCHGGVINVWAAHVLGMPPRLFFEPEYTSLHRFLCAGGGERNLVSLNDTAHLRTA